MRKKLLKRPLLLVAVSTMFAPLAAQATNGYFQIGFGAVQRGMGGASVAYPKDGLASSVNAASMIDVGTRFDIGGDLFIAKSGVFVDSNELPADHESEREFFIIPNMGGVYKYSDKITLGASVVGAGAATKYTQATAECSDSNLLTVSNNFFNFSCNASDRLSIDLYQMQMLPSIAYKINDNHSVGFTLAVAFQAFRAYGFGAMEALGFTNSSGSITNNGWDFSWGIGARVSWFGKFMDEKLRLGFNYAPEVNMTEFDKYKGLFAEAGDFDIPETTAFGVSYAVNKDIDVAFDIQRVNFGDVASVGNPGPNPTGGFFPCGDITCGALGLPQGLGFGWDNQTAYKLGVNYDYDDVWSFRSGINYGASTIKKEDVLFNTMAPAVVEWHYSLGATWRFAKDMEANFSYIHAFENTVRGSTAFSARPAGEDNAALTMIQDSFGASLGIKW